MDSRGDAALSEALGLNATLSVNATTITSVVEAACPAGSWCATGSPIPCAAGHVAPHNDTPTCDKCQGGTYQGQEGGTACTACEVGHYCPVGAVAPDSCPGGTFSNATNASSEAHCILCPLGHHCPRGSSTPRPCTPGAFAGALGSKECTQCDVGHEQPLPNATRCEPCRMGFFAQNPGQQECSQCLTRLSSAEGSSSCTVCAADFYLHDVSLVASQENCRDCPPSAECPWATTLESLGVPANHWRLSLQTIDIHRCPEQGGVAESPCLGGGGPSAVASGNGTRARRRADETGMYCIADHAGPRCEECLEDGVYFDRLTYRCKTCPGAGRIALVIGGGTGAIVLVIAVVLGLGKAQPHSLPWVLRGAAAVARWCIERSLRFVIRLGLQGKFKIVVSFYRATQDRTRDLHASAPAHPPY